jgi:hypothetical protein
VNLNAKTKKEAQMAEKSKQHLNGKVMGDHPLQKSAVEAIKREAVRLLL